MTHDEAGALAEKAGIDLAHDCQERAAECVCDPDEDAPEGHAAGDGRCPNRALHSACSHAQERLAEVTA